MELMKIKFNENQVYFSSQLNQIILHIYIIYYVLLILILILLVYLNDI